MAEFFDAMQSGATPLRQVVLSLLCAYLMSHSIGALYAWTRRGKEYSRSFVQALVIGGIVGAMIMLAIGNSLARGVGIVGALALIRFRTNLRDPLDMIFIFAAFAAGISAGAGNIATGMVGTTIFGAVVLAMHMAGTGASQVEVDLRLRIAGDDVVAAEAAVREILKVYAAGYALLKRRTMAPAKEKPAEQRLAYRVVLRRVEDEPALMRALAATPSVSEVALSLESASTAGGGSDDD